jgi:plasmid stabilization system protein ParE
VAQIVYAQTALDDLARAFEFIAGHDPRAAKAAAVSIREAVETLANHPLIGRIVETELRGELRELVISFGKTGYVALYRFLPAQEQIRILAIRHQRELDYPG